MMEVGVAIACLEIWVLSWGLILLVLEASTVSLVLLLFVLPSLTYAVIARFSLPPANPLAVQQILGVDFKKEWEKRKESISDILINSVCAGDGNHPEMLVIKLIAHRFAGIDAPENSLAALEACYQKGCVAVEFDVSLTVDKVPVVFHDSTTDRLTNLSKEIQKITWEELQTMDIAVNHPFYDRYKGTKVARLIDVVDKCLEYDIRMVIDIKDFSQDMVQIICDLYDKQPALYMRAIVSSFNPFVIYAIRQKKPDVVGGMAWRPYHMSYYHYSPVAEECKRYYSSTLAHWFACIADHITTWAFNNLYYYITGISAVLINKNVINYETVNWWERKGIRVIAWTVNIPSEKVHFSKNLKITYMTDTMAGD